MSANKETDSTKFTEEENTESGYLSGCITISEQLLSEEIDVTRDSDSSSQQPEVPSEPKPKVEVEEDQGVVLGELVDIDSAPAAAAQPPVTGTLHEHANTVNDNLLAFLFRQDEDGDTQLHIAAVHGCTKTVAMIIKLCRDKTWLDIVNDYGHTALHLAIMSQHVVVARMLVLAGASLAIRDHTGETPLHTAIHNKQDSYIEALLEPAQQTGHQRINQRISAAVLDQKNYNGQACVHLAATAGRVDLLKRLVFYGADINAREGLAGWTPLHIAARRSSAELAQHLLNKCPGVWRSVRDYAGRTPRRLARRSPFEQLFNYDADESDSETDDDEYDSESEQLFERLSEARGAPSIDVV